jgi:hypothetical protein
MNFIRAQRAFIPHWFLVLLTAWFIPWLTRKTEKPGEWYPFSNFPMYSTFEPATYYVYVTDLKDKPVALSDVFSTSTSNVKKAYDRKLKNSKKSSGDKGKRSELPLDQRRVAAKEVLEWLTTSASKKDLVQALGGIRLHQVDIVFRDGVVSKSTTAVGEIAFNSTPPAP